MSHVTKLKTAITKQFILKETLKNLGLPWTEFDIDLSNKLTVNLEKNPRLEFAILQENGSNITFLWTGEAYEIGIDVSQWQQGRSISGFMSTVEQTYAWTLLNTSAETTGFDPDATIDPNLENDSIEEKDTVLVCSGWN